MLQNIKLRRPGKDMKALLKTAGFREATPLQEQYLSSALQGRDLIVESIEGDGKTIAQLLPFLSASRARKKTPTALILTDSVESVEKYEQEYRKFPGTVTRGISLAALGKEDQPKKELKLLSKQPAIIVGTTERIIDHIRRDNISFSGDTTVVVNIPESKDRLEFNRDIEFILTKIPRNGGISLFTASGEHVEELEYLLKRPLTLSAGERTRQMPVFHLYRGRELSPSAILELIYAENLYRVLLLVHTRAEVEEFVSFLGSHGINSRSTDSSVSTTLPSHEKEEAESYRCTVSTFRDAGSIGLNYHSIIFFGLPDPDRENLFVETGKAVSGNSNRPNLSVIIPPGREDNFRSVQEKYQMSTQEEQFPQQEEVLKGQLKSIIKQIKEEENPDLLNKYRKLIKQSVPFHMRGYLSAFLFKKMVEGDTHNVLQTDASEMQTIFVSIGKNRKVFPRDLARLFRSNLDLGPNDIGNIKVLDNYSFIDIPKNRAKEAIDKMDNMDFRSRTITVNFARKKNDKKNEKKGSQRGQQS